MAELAKVPGLWVENGELGIGSVLGGDGDAWKKGLFAENRRMLQCRHSP